MTIYRCRDLSIKIEKTGENSTDVGSSSILANQFKTKDYSTLSDPVNKVMILYKEWLTQKITKKDKKILVALQKILNELRDSKNISLKCEYSPLKCHAETIANEIMKRASKNENFI